MENAAAAVRRILFVAPFPPRTDGTHGGSRAIAQAIVDAATRHPCALAYFRYPTEPPLDDAVRSALDAVVEIPRPLEQRLSPGHLVRALRWRAGVVVGRPRWVSELTLPGVRPQIAALAARWRPDVVRLEYTVTAAHAAAVGTAPSVVVDLDPDLAGSHATVDPSRARRLDLRAWERHRRRAYAGADAVVVFTERDRAVVEPLAAATPVRVIPAAAPLPPVLDATGREDTVLFVGNLNHPSNQDAARHLVDDVMPRVRERRPGATLAIVGDTAGLGDELARPGVLVSGVVPDILPHLDAAAVVVAPVRIGGGMRLKCLDALAAGKALVAYPSAVEGLGARSGEHLLVAHGPDDFAARVVELLDGPERRVQLGRAAAEWAAATFDRARALDAWDALYRELRAPRASAAMTTSRASAAAPEPPSSRDR